MTRRELFDRMLEAAESIFDKVEVVNGNFRGGVCRVRNERCLILNRGAGLETNLRILSTHLAGGNSEEIYLVPQVRDAIEQYSSITSNHGDSHVSVC